MEQDAAIQQPEPAGQPALQPEGQSKQQLADAHIATVRHNLSDAYTNAAPDTDNPQNP